MQPLDNFSEAAKIAYQAFLDMSQSKAAHFNALEAIDTLYESGGAPSLAENLELKKLLEQHDRNVLAFTTAVAAVEDLDEKKALLQMMS